ncbi:MAG: HAMP domain-containing histidine kinase [Tissierellia bacterium]|nr:HAMP domain-containing histidine kinase [Tissierellia bacterium]
MIYFLAITVSIITLTVSYSYSGLGIILELLILILIASTITLTFLGIAVFIRHIRKKQLADRSLLMQIWKNFGNRNGMKLAVLLSLGMFLLVGPFNVWGNPGKAMVVITGGGFALAFFHRSIEMQVLEQNLRRIITGKELELPDRISDSTKEDLVSLAELHKQVEASLMTSINSERTKTELITNISHDLKTPLTSIINYADILQQPDLTEEEDKRFKDVLRRNAERMKVLINDLVFATKTNTGNLEIITSELELNELVLQCYSLVDREYAKKDLELVYESSHDAIIIESDGDHLSRLVENLFNNSAKYALNGTRVYVDSTFEDNKATVSIKNISEHALNISVEELMERFVRGDKSRHTEGSGLGLYIAGNLAELLGGKLLLSIDGDLFTAKLVLPAKSGENEPEPKDDSETPKKSNDSTDQKEL